MLIFALKSKALFEASNFLQHEVEEKFATSSFWISSYRIVSEIMQKGQQCLAFVAIL